MSFHPRQMPPLPASGTLRQGFASSSQQSSALVSRLNAKKAELENLKQLRDVSGALAGRMEALEEKLSTLRDGTEAVACVMANWGNVLSAIRMASTAAAASQSQNVDAAKDEEGSGEDNNNSENPPLPAALVRIPIDQEQSVP